LSGALATGAIALAFVAIHITIGWFRELDRTPRSIWLSLAGGVAVAYVFLHILPELAAHQDEFSQSSGLTFWGADLAVFGLALAGLAAFYLLDQWARHHARASGRDDMEEVPREVAAMHLASFACYNALIGYLLVRGEQEGGWELVAFALALGVHFVTTDHALRRENRSAYDRIARWVLSGAVLAGWGLGRALMVSDLFVGCLFAFLGGAVILNTLKEELPAERESRVLPFLAGASLYGVLLVAIGGE